MDTVNVHQSGCGCNDPPANQRAPVTMSDAADQDVMFNVIPDLPEPEQEEDDSMETFINGRVVKTSRENKTL